MKKSMQVTLTVVAAMGMAACQRRVDPCESSYFDEQACEQAVRSGGYYWHGSWYPMVYHYPYPYYYDSYRTYVQRGGRIRSASPGAYSHPGSGVTRGGFGSTGASHSSGG